MTLELTPEQAKALRSIGAKINGALGGMARTTRKIKSSRRNVRKAIKARIAIAA